MCSPFFVTRTFQVRLQRGNGGRVRGGRIAKVALQIHELVISQQPEEVFDFWRFWELVGTYFNKNNL